MRKFIIKCSKYIIPLLVLSLYCMPVFADWTAPSGYGPEGDGTSHNITLLVLYAYYFIATFMLLMGTYQLARGFVDEEFSKNKKDGLVFMVFAVVMYAVAISGGVTMRAPGPTLGTVWMLDEMSGNGPISVLQKVQNALLPIAEAVILWGIVHYIMAFTRDGLQDKHKGILLIGAGFLLSFFPTVFLLIMAQALKA